LLGGHSAYLLEGELTAYGIVHAELVEGLARARQGHDARTARHCRTRGESYGREKGQKFQQVTHGIISLARMAALPVLSASHPDIP